MSKRNTINKSFKISGKGLHTGTVVDLVCKPLLDQKGIYFKRMDQDTETLIPAEVSHVYETNRCTSIKKDDIEVHTVEHLLSALAAKKVHDLLIELNGPEVPILDGSAKQIIEAINEVGILEKEDEVDEFVIDEIIEFFHEETGASYTVIPSDKLDITVNIDFEGTTIGKQYARLSDFENYERDIASAKTFVVLKDLEALVKNNLAKGGSLDNALVYTNGQGEDQIMKIARVFGVENQMSIDNGIINGNDLKYENEPARHKLLDLIGDLSLLGRPIKAKIFANKPGHASNVDFAKHLKKLYLAKRKLQGKPIYDENQEPIFDLEKIKEYIPHRHPFLLIDKIIELTGNKVVGIKSVTGNEDVFNGHFPNNPVFPGVLQIEAMAQTGGILALSTVEDPGNWNTYFLKIDNVKFKHMVKPGDTMILKMELMSPIRRGIFQMQGTAYVGNKIVSEGELTAKILKKN